MFLLLGGGKLAPPNSGRRPDHRARLRGSFAPGARQSTLKQKVHGTYIPGMSPANATQEKDGCPLEGYVNLYVRRCNTSSPEGPSTQYLRTLVPKTIPLMVFRTRVLKYWVFDP